jgi:hypothetical protein
MFAAGVNTHSSGLRWRGHCHPLGKKKELLFAEFRREGQIML